jgi:hypothetical protein
MTNQKGFIGMGWVLVLMLVSGLAGYFLFKQIPSNNKAAVVPTDKEKAYIKTSISPKALPTSQKPSPDGTPTPTRIYKSNDKFASMEDFDAILNKDTFKHDTENVENTPGYLIVSTIYSNDKSKLAITEVSKEIFKYDSLDKLFYTINIKDLKTNKTTLLRKINLEDHFQSELPIFWSTNDKYLVTFNTNLPGIGMGGSDDYSYYKKIDISNGNVTDLAPYGVTTADKRYVLYVENNPSFEQWCTSNWGYPGSNYGQITRKKIEDGTTKVLTNQKYMMIDGQLIINGDTVEYKWKDYYKMQDTPLNLKKSDAEFSNCLELNDNTNHTGTVKIY